MGAAGRGGYPSFYDDRAGYFDSDGNDLRVETTDFESFATNIRLEMNNFVANWNAACFPLLKACGVAFGNRGEFLEAAWTRAHHNGVADAASMLFKDMALGFQAISTAALTIATEYRNGDLEGSEAIDAVRDTFYPGSGENSLEQMREELNEDDDEGDQNNNQGGQNNDQGGQNNTTATQVPDEVKNPTDNPSSPGSRPTTVGSGDGRVTIPGDPYTNVPRVKN